MNIAKFDHTVFYAVIDCIWRLPPACRTDVLQHVLQQKTSSKKIVAHYLLRNCTAYGLEEKEKAKRLTDMRIDIRVIAHSGPGFFNFLRDKYTVSQMSQPKRRLLLGLYNWVTPWHVTSRDQRRAIITWFPSASAFERQFLADRVSKTDLYRACVTTRVSHASILGDRNGDNRPAELRSVLEEPCQWK